MDRRSVVLGAAAMPLTAVYAKEMTMADRTEWGYSPDPELPKENIYYQALRALESEHFRVLKQMANGGGLQLELFLKVNEAAKVIYEKARLAHPDKEIGELIKPIAKRMGLA